MTTRKLAKQAARRAALRPPLSDCKKCGTPHRTKDGNQACTHHISGGYDKTRPDVGRGCMKAPMIGQTECDKHGGKTPVRMRAAQRRIAEKRSMAAMGRFGGPIETTASEALLNTVKWTAGYVAWLRTAVERLRLDQLGWGITQEKTGGQDWGTTEKAGQSVYAAMLGEWTDRLVKVCATALKAGIEERKVRLAEQQGQLVADVIKRVLNDLDLTNEQQAKSGEIVVRHLQLLTA